MKDYTILMLVGLLALMLCCKAHSEEIIDFNLLADAIYQAEGGQQGELYGIHSVHYSTELEARQICIRTIKHKFKQWNKQGDFIHYLSTKYCPKNHNVWEKNVKFFYQRFKSQVN